MSRLGRALAGRLEDAAAPPFVMGTVTAATSPRVQVAIETGGVMMLPRLASYTPAISDSVLIARTNAGWLVIGKIAT